MIERKIIIGLIVSTDFLQQVRHMWDAHLLESVTARRMAGWCWEYFERYNRAPMQDIEGIFYAKLKDGGVGKDVAEEIEQDILPKLSEEFAEGGFNLQYTLDETYKYLRERRVLRHAERLEGLLAEGEVDEAEKTACEYHPIMNGSETELILNSEVVLKRVELAFDEASDPLIQYDGRMGEFFGHQLTRASLVAFLAPEKRGKTFWMLDMAMKACKQGKRVAFFQAGDLTEGQLLKRVAIYLARRSDRERYCVGHYEPVRDCVHNQTDTCRRECRVCSFGVFEGRDINEIRTEVQMDELIDAYENNKEYVRCTRCKEYDKNNWGAVWLQWVDGVDPLTKEEATKKIHSFFINTPRHMRLSTHANNTLSIAQIRATLGVWEKADGFIPDIIVVDYADLLVPEVRMEFRHQQNEIWKGLRRLSQEKGQPLVITATQADAESYKQGRLRLSNFSEDKRKYSHATAFYGLNQDPRGREKRIGLMRINELLLREDDYDTGRDVYVLQNLRRGRAYLGSFF